MSKQTVIDTINSVVKTNGIQSITGSNLNSVLKDIVDYIPEPVNTIADLRNLEGEKDEVITLLGYYEAGDKEPLNYVFTTTQGVDDGGAVINSENGSWKAILPTVVSPLHFGARGNGLNDDTKALKSCFDYGSSFDGHNRTYVTSSSDISYLTSWGNNYGLYTNAGKTFRNFKFKTANNTSRDTSILALIVTGLETNDTLFENCSFDGNEVNQSVSYSGREDGGKHLLSFYRVDSNSLVDFLPTKNIYIKNCIFKDQYSYGFFCHPLDCELHIESTYFEGTGLFCCPFVTTFYLDNFKGKMKAKINDSTKLPNFFVDEMEFDGEYTGAKKVNRYLKNVRTFCTSEDIDSNITFGIFDNPQSNLKYDNFIFDDVLNISPSGAFKRVFDCTASKSTHSVFQNLKFIKSGGSAVVANPNPNSRKIFVDLHFIDNVGAMDIRSGNANAKNVYVSGIVNIYALYNLNCDNIFGNNITYKATTLSFLLGNTKNAFMNNSSFENETTNFLFEGGNVNLFVNNCYYKSTALKPINNSTVTLSETNFVIEN